MKTIKILSTQWAEYVGYVGTERHASFADEWAAREWLSSMLASGQYRLSEASIVTGADVAKHKARQGL